MEDFKRAVSLVFRKGNFVLALKRSPSKESFPEAWSIPSTYILEGEEPADAANRLVKRKLGLSSVVLKEKSIGVSSVVDRGTYKFQMTDYEVEEYEGQIAPNSEEYTEMRWVTPAELLDLIKTENSGDMGECTKTLLKFEGVI